MRDPVVGDAFDQYQLTELLARSGMASIFKAVDTLTDSPVALKIPHVQYESDIVFSERFRREEEVGQTLDHPNLVKILKPRQKSRIYMAMELVEGKSLRALMNGRTPLSTPQALDLAQQICDALQYLHAHGVIHRDIKPENILITATGQAKILDFGIALFEAERRLTWAGFSQSVGTPDYMAPEQVRGRRGDPRTDIYAVGLLLYEMLTCNLPYESANARALLRAKTNEEPRAPSYYIPNFDPSLEAIILKAIERDPRHRYGTAAELLADLRNPSAVAPRDGQALLAARRQGGLPRQATLVVLVMVIVVGLTALMVLTQRRSTPTDDPGVAARPR
jgi:serine/threonine-protein kinase